jgi:4-carboxymuconolactone decarboxylase
MITYSVVADPTLDQKTRSLNEPCDAHGHEPGTRDQPACQRRAEQRCHRREIKAALLHATAYCGIPAGLDAFRAAHEVLVSEGVLPKPGTPAR